MKEKGLLLSITSAMLVACTETFSPSLASDDSSPQIVFSDKDLALIEAYSGESFQISESNAVNLAKQFYCDML
jgi:uncharacterized protein YcfL